MSKTKRLPIAGALTGQEWMEIDQEGPKRIRLSDLPGEGSGGPDRFLGVFISLAALTTAHPSATPGEFAQVDPGPGTDVINYSWDADEGWIQGGSGGMVPLATESVAGIAEIATSAEVATGTDDQTFVTPLKLKEITAAIISQLDTAVVGNKLFNFYNFR